MSEIIDTLITKLEYEADDKVIAAADKQLKKLEKSSKATARATDVLADEQHTLKIAVQETSEKQQKLRKEQRRLRLEIKATKKPTEDQRKALKRVDHQLEEARESAQRYRNELKRLGIQQAKIARQSRREAKDIKRLGSARRRAAPVPSPGGGGGGGGGSGLAGALAVAGPAGAALGAVATGVATAAGGAAIAIKTVVDAGAEMEGLRARLKTVEGSVDGATEAFSLLKDIAVTTPFELQDVTNAYVRLKSLGIQPTEQSLKAFGNVAAAQGKPIIDFIEAVADASTGEFERLKEFGIKASSQGEQVAFTFGGVTTKIKKDAKSITAFLEGLGQTEFAGAMADQMDTFNGVISNLKDTWTNFLDGIAQQGVLDEVKLLVKDIAGTMEEDLIPIIADTLIQLLQWVRETFVDVRDTGGGVVETVQSLADSLATIAMVLEPFIWLWQAGLTGLTGIIQVGGKVLGFFKNLFEAIGRLLEPVTEAVDKFGILHEAWFNAKAIGGELAANIDLITSALFSQAEAITVVKGSLQDLQQQVGTDASKLTDKQLQELRAGGGDAAERADAEIRKRIKQREGEERVSDQKDRVTSFKQSQNQKAENAAKDFSKFNDRQLASFATDPNVAKKLRDKAEKEQAKRKKKRRSSGAKAAKSLRDATLIADIQKQIEKNARELAQAEAARGLRSGKLTAANAGAFETQRFKEIKEKQTRAFELGGQLPAGIAQDVRQIAALPSINDLAGRTQAPVISNTIINVDVSGNEFNAIVEGGTFDGSPSSFARATLVTQRRDLQKLLAESVPNFRTQELR